MTSLCLRISGSRRIPTLNADAEAIFRRFSPHSQLLAVFLGSFALERSLRKPQVDRLDSSLEKSIRIRTDSIGRHEQNEQFSGRMGGGIYCGGLSLIHGFIWGPLGLFISYENH